MILIDTNVISELIKPKLSGKVFEWFNRQNAEALYLSAVVEAELRLGAAILPHGKRRDQLTKDIDDMITNDFADKVLPFDSAATTAFADIFAERKAIGREISLQDCMIAATARAYNASIATRNTKDFENCGIDLINPWR